jgi:hypothetical protein
MATPAKPTILFVCGAWHPPQVYAPLQEELERRGYEFVIPRLQTLGEDKNGVTWEADVTVLLKAVEPLFEAGKEVIVMAHSYGGIPGCVLTEGRGVADRKREGKAGGFVGIVFLAAFAVPKKGMDLLQTFGGIWPNWQKHGDKYTGVSIDIL